MASETDRAAMTRPRTLLIIGGAEDKIGRSVVLKRFVRLAGGRQSRIVIIPTASSFVEEVGQSYTSVFTRLRAGTDIQIVSIVHGDIFRDIRPATTIVKSEFIDARILVEVEMEAVYGGKDASL